MLESVFTGNQSVARQKQALGYAHQILTPLEFKFVSQTLSARSPAAAAALQDLILGRLLAKEAPARYVRKQITPDVTLFTNPDMERARKTIVFAFCGLAQRLMLPTGTFLQLLAGTTIDIVTINDPERSHFTGGLQGYAADFVGLVRRLENDLQPGTYKNTGCFGTSMGGFPALRCGLLLQTKAIAVGGRFIWHVDRLQTGISLPAFDLLCACKDPGAARFVCVYGIEDDRKAVDQLATFLPVTRVLIRGPTGHNVLYTMLMRGTIRQFLSDQFTFDAIAAGHS